MSTIVQERIEIRPIRRTENQVIASERILRSGPSYEAYQILRWGFVALPIIAGLDKFAGFLVNWDKYLAPTLAELLPFNAHFLMLVIGAIEVVAGFIVAVKPRVGAYIVGVWLCAIIVNLSLFPGYLDIALRDFGLVLGALALGRLSKIYNRA